MEKPNIIGSQPVFQAFSSIGLFLTNRRNNFRKRIMRDQPRSIMLVAGMTYFKKYILGRKFVNCGILHEYYDAIWVLWSIADCTNPKICMKINYNCAATHEYVQKYILFNASVAEVHFPKILKVVRVTSIVNAGLREFYQLSS